MHSIDDSFYLFFCCDEELQSDERRAAGTGTGTFWVRADHPLGTFDVGDARPLEVDMNASAYAGRVIDSNGPKYLSWVRNGPNGVFVGELADPQAIVVTEAGIELS